MRLSGASGAREDRMAIKRKKLKDAHPEPASFLWHHQSHCTNCRGKEQPKEGGSQQQHLCMLLSHLVSSAPLPLRQQLLHDEISRRLGKDTTDTPALMNSIRLCPS